MTVVDKRLVAGFTLIELMIVVLIVAILAAVAVPIFRGRMDAAKWSEGRAGAGTIASSIRAYAAEKGDFASFNPDLVTDLGFGVNELDGTYFLQASYTATASCAAGQVAFSIVVDPGGGKGRATAPTAPATMTLAANAGNNYVATWSQN